MSEDEKHKGLLVACTMGIFYFFLTSGDFSIKLIAFGIFISIGQSIDWLVYYPKYKKYLVKQHEQELLESKMKNEYMKVNGIPKEANGVRCIDGACFNDISNHGVYIWIDKNCLCLMGGDYKNRNNKKHSIPIESIKYYTIQGDIYNKVNVRGNISGGSSSIKGAIIGGALAGSTGAIIGSRKPVNANIKTSNKRIDERETLLVIENNSKVNRIVFRAYAYKILTRLIPEKDKEYIMLSDFTHE